MTCSCNHLTHFAILLSPGVEKVYMCGSDIKRLIRVLQVVEIY